MVARTTARIMVTMAPDVVSPFCSTMHRWFPAVSVVQYSPSTHTDAVVATREQSYVLVASHDVMDVSFSVEQTKEVVVVVAASVVVAVVSVGVVVAVTEVAASVVVEPSVVVVSRLPR